MMMSVALLATAGAIAWRSSVIIGCAFMCALDTRRRFQRSLPGLKQLEL